MSTHVIIGAGQAGGQAARSMRQCGFDGRIVLIGEEAHPPYQRPPLSKALLLGKIPVEKTYLFRGDWCAENDVELRLGVRVAALDAEAREVRLEDGTRLTWDKLLLATGARLRRLPVPGADLAGVHYLRSIEDCLRLREAFAPERRVVIVGGGFIGLEVAAAARELGCTVSVLEATDRLMGRAVDRELGEYFMRLHRGHGVELRLATEVTGIEGNGAVAGVRCGADRLTADCVVVGIGIQPEDALARQIGAALGDGVLVDRHCATSVPGVYACGDVACHNNTAFGGRLRLESWENAQNQAIAAAASMCGEAQAYDPVPWFWTNQYDVNLQMAGAPAQWDARVVRGDPQAGPFSVFYLNQGRVVACNAINSPRELRTARKLIEQGAAPAPGRLQDPGVDLKSLLDE